jgi:hypothetical protein
MRQEAGEMESAIYCWRTIALLMWSYNFISWGKKRGKKTRTKKLKKEKKKKKAFLVLL